MIGNKIMLNIKLMSTIALSSLLIVSSMQVNAEQSIQNNMANCGVVSVHVNPPKAKDIFPASIQKIDKDHLKRDRNSFKLSVGKHTILLQEYIDIKNFTIRVRSRAKPLEINVEKNTIYHIGAKYNRDKGFKIHKGGYWSPVVWKTSNKECVFN